MKLIDDNMPTSDVESLPARGAWIETDKKMRGEYIYEVAPREGSVD